MNEIYFVKTVDNSRWVPPVNAREPRRYVKGVVLSALILGACLFSARERLESRENGYRVEQLSKQKQELLEANRKLRLEEASLVDPSRIDWIARTQLGMSPLAPNQIFRGEQPSGAVVAQRPGAVDADAAATPKLTASLR